MRRSLYYHQEDPAINQRGLRKIDCADAVRHPHTSATQSGKMYIALLVYSVVQLPSSCERSQVSDCTDRRDRRAKPHQSLLKQRLLYKRIFLLLCRHVVKTVVLPCSIDRICRLPKHIRDAGSLTTCILWVCWSHFPFICNACVPSRMLSDTVWAVRFCVDMLVRNTIVSVSAMVLKTCYGKVAQRHFYYHIEVAQVSNPCNTDKVVCHDLLYLVLYHRVQNSISPYPEAALSILS